MAIFSFTKSPAGEFVDEKKGSPLPPSREDAIADENIGEVGEVGDVDDFKGADDLKRGMKPRQLSAAPPPPRPCTSADC